jgi:predicted nucleic acid-binding protein
MLVVCDANVLASGTLGLRGTHSAPGAVLRQIPPRGCGRSIVGADPPRTLEKPYFAARLTEEERRAAVNSVRDVALDALLTREVHGVATHPEDDLVLATALSVTAEFLVTGDKALLALGPWEGVQIVAPATYLALQRM